MKKASYAKGDILWCYERVSDDMQVRRTYVVVMADNEYFAVAPRTECIDKNDVRHYVTDFTAIELYSQGDGCRLRFELC